MEPAAIRIGAWKLDAAMKTPENEAATPLPIQNVTFNQAEAAVFAFFWASRMANENESGCEAPVIDRMIQNEIAPMMGLEMSEKTTRKTIAIHLKMVTVRTVPTILAIIGAMVVASKAGMITSAETEPKYSSEVPR